MRLKGLDYKRPFFYMVTLKRAAEGGSTETAFSRISEKGEIAPTVLTPVLEAVIRRFHETWYCIEPICHYVIMPDHLHLIVKMRDIEKRVSLAVVVRQLIKTLEKAIVGAERQEQNQAVQPIPPQPKGKALPNSSQPQCTVPPGSPNPQGKVLLDSLRESIFAFEWHDWIVKKKGQLAAFIRYIEENPKRAWRRRQNRRYFGSVRKVVFAGREWYAYGNTDLLQLPVIEPFKCSRKWTKDGKEWNAALEKAGRIGPAGAGVGTFMSPCEKECGNAIFKAGGAIIVLCPEGFHERWHPTRNKEALCAAGRMLFLSLYEASAAKPDNATLYQRCHEMGDLVVAVLASSGSASRLVSPGSTSRPALGFAPPGSAGPSSRKDLCQ